MRRIDKMRRYCCRIHPLVFLMILLLTLISVSDVWATDAGSSGIEGKWVILTRGLREDCLKSTQIFCSRLFVRVSTRLAGSRACR